MKSLQKSWGKFCPEIHYIRRLGLAASLGAILSACNTFSKPGGTINESSSYESSSNETSLASDRDELEKLRKNMPDQKREENDQLKILLNLTGEVKEHPSKIREKFSRQMQKIRDKHWKANSQLRKEFDRNEKKSREDFYAKLAQDRKQFSKKKHNRDETKNFYDRQDEARREFSAEERDRRNEFNGEMKSKADNFNAETREQNQEFNEQMKDYSRRYNEWQKGKSDSKKNSSKMLNSQNANFPSSEKVKESVNSNIPLESEQTLKTGNKDK